MRTNGTNLTTTRSKQLHHLATIKAIVLHWRTPFCAVITRVDTGKRATYWPTRGTVYTESRGYQRNKGPHAVYILLG